MSERLYGRQVIAEIGVPGQNFRRWEGLRISARVRLGLESSPNSAEIDIYNLTRDSISRAQEKGAAIRLFAGYSTPRLIFAGPINRGGAVMTKQGPDRILSIEAKDGGIAYQAARINKTFDRGMSLQNVFDALAEETGLPLGAVEIPDGAQLTQGVTLTGRVSDALDRLATMTSAEWSIQQGELQFLPRGQTTPDQAVLVSSAPGSRNLIGSPAPGNDGLEVRALLDGRLKPGRRIKLKSDQFEGVYRIRQVEHALDSGWDQPFYSDLILRET